MFSILSGFILLIMIKTDTLVFNPFQINTFILSDETGECIIIDPGCSDPSEDERLKSFLKENNLRPVRNVNTHCHLDHVMGNNFVHKIYGLFPECHAMEKPVLLAADSLAGYFNVKNPESPLPQKFLKEGDIIKLGNSAIQVLFTPGHSPGHITLYCKEDKYIICGDVLFLESIGRTDLPGGNYNMLVDSIRQKLYTLPDDVCVYPGHGDPTTIGHEKQYNPFVRF